MFLTYWLESITYLFIGSIRAPNEQAGPYSQYSASPSVTSSVPPTSIPTSVSTISPHAPNHCFSCVFNDLLNTSSPRPDQYSYDLLRLEFCDTPNCQAWADDVRNYTSADICGAFTAGIGCKLTCSYSVKPDIGIIDALADELCPNGRSSGHLPPQGG